MLGVGEEVVRREDQVVLSGEVRGCSFGSVAVGARRDTMLFELVSCVFRIEERGRKGKLNMRTGMDCGDCGEREES